MQTNPLAHIGLCADTHPSLTPATRPSPIIPLAELASVHSGYAVPGKYRCASGNILLLQEKDLNNALAGPLACAQVKRAPTRHFLQTGDIVMKLRGSSNPAMLIEAPQAATVCTAGLVYIRVLQPGRLLPGYLTWFLNCRATQAGLAKFTRSGRVRVLNADNLLRLGVMLPNVERQQLIALTHGLNQQIGALEQQLLEKKLQYADEAMFACASRTV